MGRPERLTPERQARFLKAIRAGAFPEVAAAYAGFSSASYYKYMHGVSPQHATFRREVVRAQSELELDLVGTITREAGSNPRWAFALLERRFPKRWGPGANPEPDLAEAVDPEQRSDERVISLNPDQIAQLLRSIEAVRLEAAKGQGEVDIDRFEERQPRSRHAVES